MTHKEDFKTTPKPIGGEYTCNPSKSEMQRALILALLSEGTSTLSPVDESNDSLTMLKNIEKLGAIVEKVIQNGQIMQLKISGGKINKKAKINCGESGFGLRSITPVLACCGDHFEIDGEGSLMKRPLDLLVDMFSEFDGVKMTTQNGQLPLLIEGKLKTNNLKMDGSKSSQHISGLLLGLPLLEKETRLTIKDLKSKPYLDLTIEMMRVFGLDVKQEGNMYCIPSKNYQATNYQVNGDWSGAAFLITGAFLHGNELKINNLDISSTQADRAIMEVIALSGGSFDCRDKTVVLHPTQNPTNFSFDATHSPDLFPPLTVLAAGIKGVSKIKGLHRLQHKESDRKESIEYLLKAFKVPYKIKEDTLEIIGGKISTPNYPINTFNDHRIAMSAFILCGFCKGETTIKDVHCINKSYPHFIRDWKSLRKD